MHLKIVHLTASTPPFWAFHMQCTVRCGNAGLPSQLIHSSNEKLFVKLNISHLTEKL